MSHVVLEEFPMNSLETLIGACKYVDGVEFVRDQKNFNWYGTYMADYDEENAAMRILDPKDFGKCEHVIRIKDNKTAYEVGIMRNPNTGAWAFVYDFYGKHGRDLLEKVGQGCKNLKAAYTIEANRRAALRAGARNPKVVRKGNKMILTIQTP